MDSLTKSIIVIQRVNNGFVLTLPSDDKNVQAFDSVLDKLKNFSIDLKDDEQDPLLKDILSQIKKDDKENHSEFESDANMFVFMRFKDLISFLNEKFPEL
ncbi:MAG: hypothetical protein V4547_10545 [Bacteroidota bacterium]